MTNCPQVSVVDLEALRCVRDAALSGAPISLGVRRTASPHEFYRYPARFSPELAASTIKAFSAPGDLVADFFVGGGTTLVEARRSGRLGVGSDINSLSVFVSRAKTRVYTAPELDEVTTWANAAIAPGSPSDVPTLDPADLSYLRNVEGDELAAQRALLLRAVSELASVTSTNARALARCVLLRTAQWGFDMRREVPTAFELAQALVENASTTATAAAIASREYRIADEQTKADGMARSHVVHQGLPGISQKESVRRRGAPQLVLTSPPYPGVYVNYHRWKVRGRRETPLPYLLAGQQDGNGLAYYTMAARSDRSLRAYFDRLERAFRDVGRVCDEATTVVQVVGFSDVRDQLERYLETMSRSGFVEIKLDALATAEDGRLWREVPGRRWWARAGGRSDVVAHTAREVVLIHRLAA